MALIDELKQQRAEMDEKYHRAIADGSYYCGRLNDLDTAIAALEPPAQPHGELRDAPPAVLRDEPEIPEGFTKWDGKSACRFHSETIVECWMGQDDFMGPLRAGDVDWDHHSDPVLAVKVIRYPNGMTPEQPDDATDISTYATLEVPFGFIRHDGDMATMEFELLPDTLVEVYRVDGRTERAEVSLFARHGRWTWNGSDGDIIAYRIITPEAKPGTQIGIDADASNFFVAPHVYTEGGYSRTFTETIRGSEHPAFARPPEGYAPVVDAEAILDATELAQVTIDKVPPTAEVIKDATGRPKFARYDGQTHEVVEPSNTEADFWARALFPKKKEQA